MKTRLLWALLIAMGLSSCANHPATPAYEVSLPSCRGDNVRVCENFGEARDERQCACVSQVLVYFD